MNQPGVAAERRLAFIMVICAVLYLAFVVYMLHARGLFVYIGVDFRNTWSSATIARTEGFAQVYNYVEQIRQQGALVTAFAAPGHQEEFAALAMAYPPAFVALFVPFGLIPPDVSFGVWTGLNLALLCGYMIWFWRQARDDSGPPGSGRAVLLAILLCFPLLETFQFGQVNPWLAICMGEFVRLGMKRADFRSGLWLALLLLKPQVLIVLLPGVVLARRWRTFAGVTTGALGILAVSVAVAGVGGIMADAHQASHFSSLDGVAREMMNWRSLAIHLADVLSPEVAWSLAMTGLVITYVMGLSLWLARPDESPERFVLVALGSYAATCAVAWHSNSHTALPMAIPLVYLAARRAIPYHVLALWLLGPYLSFAFLRVVLDLGQIGMLFVNLYVLGWATIQLHRGGLPAENRAGALIVDRLVPGVGTE